MNKLFAGFVGVAGLAAAAQADYLQLPVGAPVFQAQTSWAAPISHQGSGNADTGPAVYSSIPGPYAALAAGQFAQDDDYTTNLPPNTTFTCDGFRFVGGISVANSKLDFFFLKSDNTTINTAFQINFGTNVGDFIWTITFGSADPTLTSSGFCQIQTDGPNDAGRWFFTSTPANPGTNSFTTGSGSQFNPPQIQAFEFQVPAPGSMALLGLGGLMAARRRR